MSYFHVTPAANLPSILARGLVPAIGARSISIHERAPAIYLFKDRASVEDALGNWLGEWFDESDFSGELVILQVEGIAEPPEATDMYEVVITNTIPPSSISAAYDEAWNVRPALLARTIARENCSTF